jgi:hypothetical protein
MAGLPVGASLTLESNLLPPIPLDLQAGGGESASPSWLTSWIQPRVSGTVAGIPVDYAPYGDPSPGLGVVVVAVAAVLLVWGAISALRTLTG